jgi:hypothetical protein
MLIMDVIRSCALLPPSTDVLFVLGKNKGIGWNQQDIQNDPDGLSDTSRIITASAAFLYEHMPGLQLVLSGGRTTGEGFDSQPASAYKYLHKRFPGIDPEDVELDETSPDTKQSALAALAIVSSGNYQHPAVISTEKHAKNAARLFSNHGVPLESIVAAEDIYAEHSTENELYVEAWKRSWNVRLEAAKEVGHSMLLATIDPRGDLVSNVAKVVRPTSA